MKKLIALLLAVALMIPCAALAEAPLAGGWQVYENPAPLPLPEEAAAALEKALEGLVGSTYRPIVLLGTQVVAGTNYCFLCELTPVVLDPVPHYALVYVYAALDGSAQVLSVVDLDLGL